MNKPLCSRHLTRRLIPWRNYTHFSHIKGENLPQDFTLWLDFLTPSEQQTLIRASLVMLDSVETRQHRRWRKMLQDSNDAVATSETCLIHSLFSPDKYYQFSDVRNDPVFTAFLMGQLKRG